MHSFKWVGLSVLLALSSVLSSATAFAAEPHSWCVTGAPMVPGGSTDYTANAVIYQVCGQAAFASCCATDGRWSLACVQTAAEYARDTNLSGGDYCGRYQWTNGQVAGTSQTYPRDFNLFATNGSAGGLRDSDGPIAASGDVTLLSFNLNLKRKQPVALAVQGNLVLNNGSVNGSAIYGASYRDSGVTFINATRPTAKTTPFPIDFAWAKTNLIGMSLAINRYDAKAASKVNSSITFAGTDPELNVFSVTAAQLNGTTSYTYNVPAGSYVIVNVSGTNPAITNAGFSGVWRASRTLWNFPDATTLTLNSVSFPGSLLAPKATASLQNGSLAGTVVVAAAQPGNVELYSAPYQIPSCTGGLCLDPTWSVSGDTPIDDEGKAAMIKEEAGFLELPEESYMNEMQLRTSAKQRVWYSFQPAKTEPENKPLAIMFNGGPGAATTSLLFAFNTGPYTVDPQRLAPNQKIAASAASWTQLFNLLYVDQPATGFSYPLMHSDHTQQDIGTDQDRDAGMFISVLLRFLKRHPSLEKNRVVLVGESYGGVRATKMLQHLYNSGSLSNPSMLYTDRDVSNDIRDYFTRVFSTTSPTASQIATKFGHQILIEPVVVGEKQGTPEIGTGASQNSVHKFDTSVCLPGCQSTPFNPASCDPYNCDKAAGWSDDIEWTASTALTDRATLSTALGVDVNTIAWLRPEFRELAYGREDGTIPWPTEMEAAWGRLPAGGDNYLVILNKHVTKPHAGASAWNTNGQGLISGTSFVKHLQNNVSTFITVSKFDSVVYPPDIPYALVRLIGSEPSFAALVTGIGYDRTTPWVAARPGQMRVSYVSSPDRYAAIPFQYVSGHSITQRTPAELLADVSVWYSQTPH